MDKREFDPNKSVVESMYAVMLDEIADVPYDNREVALIKDPVYFYGRYLEPKTRRYALHNLLSNVSTAIAYLNPEGITSMKLLDLGCGLGMQSIIFASLGWEVLGIDLDPRCIALCRKRKAYFEARLGRELKMQFIAHDFRTLAPDSLGCKYDAFFSMSAFAWIQPLSNTASKVSAILSDSSRIFLWDQNPGYLFLDALGWRRKLVHRPKDVLNEFAGYGFIADFLKGACAVPRQFWRSDALESATSRLDCLLTRSLRLSFSYVLGASR